MNFTANWMMRGLTLVEVIQPPVGELMLISEARVPGAMGATWPGRLNCVWLNRLKNSARNCSAVRSVIFVVFSSEASKLNWSGPRMNPTPALPKRLDPSVENGASGGAQNALALKKPGPP